MLVNGVTASKTLFSIWIILEGIRILADEIFIKMLCKM
jgi:hypothetical protein